MTSKWLYLILSVPLAAQNAEIGLNLSRQRYSSYTSYGLGINSNKGTTYAYDPTTAIAIRVGYSLMDLGPGSLQVSTAYQPDVDADLKPNGTYQWEPTRRTRYLALGAMFHFKAPVSVGAGMDARSERMSIRDVISIETGRVSYVRPWARLNVGHVFTSPKVSPFISIEAAAPLIQKHDAVDFQFGIYGGIRF